MRCALELCWCISRILAGVNQPLGPVFAEADRPCVYRFSGSR